MLKSFLFQGGAAAKSLKLGAVVPAPSKPFYPGTAPIWLQVEKQNIIQGRGYQHLFSKHAHCLHEVLWSTGLKLVSF